MDENFGPERGSYIWGRSVHNIRIERLWRDVTRGFGKKWKTFLKDLEKNFGLNPDLDEHIWLLHFLFLGGLNDDASAWAEAWNSHKLRIRDERSRSPRDMFLFGVLQNGYRNLAETFNPDSEAIANLDYYGVDWDDMEDPSILRHHADYNQLEVEEDEVVENPFNPRQPTRLSSVVVPSFECPFDEPHALQFQQELMLVPNLDTTNMEERKSVWIQALDICHRMYS
ncbi:hypothetical protein BDZ89DRAFT_1217857 [Hymenopellis radicata]|nr:hypothetical protein BDZ89DRAFT_1217857 [Hymenopellis radicata]